MIGVAWALPPRYTPDEFDLSDHMSLHQIARQICAQYRIPYRVLLSNKRDAESVKARHHFMYRAMTETTRTSVQIGKFCGNRDHTTVLHAVKRHKERMGL